MKNIDVDYAKRDLFLQNFYYKFQNGLLQFGSKLLHSRKISISPEDLFMGFIADKVCIKWEKFARVMERGDRNFIWVAYRNYFIEKLRVLAKRNHEELVDSETLMEDEQVEANEIPPALHRDIKAIVGEIDYLILYRKYVNKNTAKAIGEELNMHPSTVGSRAARAIKLLKKSKILKQYRYCC